MKSQLHWTQGSSGIDAQLREIRGAGVACVRFSHMPQTSACGLYSRLLLPSNGRKRRQSVLPASLDPWESHGSLGIDAQLREIRSAAMADVRVRYLHETRACDKGLRLVLTPATSRKRGETPPNWKPGFIRPMGVPSEFGNRRSTPTNQERRSGRRESEADAQNKRLPLILTPATSTKRTRTRPKWNPSCNGPKGVWA